MKSSPWPLLFGLMLGCYASVSRARTPVPIAPILRIEAEVHSAEIAALSADAAGTLILTASHDKTARLWSRSDGHLIRVLRPPIGEGNEGELTASALSPDGSIAAVAGWTGKSWDGSDCIYLFDTASGRLIRRLTGLPDLINVLAFSPDGHNLAAGMATGGIRVWRTDGWVSEASDTNYRGQVDSLAWDSRDRLAVTSRDGQIKLYGAQGLVAKELTPAGSHPWGVAFSPDSSKVAVGYENLAQVNILSGTNLTPVFDFGTVLAAGQSGWASPFVAWSPDGRTLYTAGQTVGRARHMFYVARSDGGRGPPQTIAIPPSNPIVAFQLLPDGALAYATSSMDWGVAGGASNVTRTGSTVNFAGTFDDFRISPDGSRVAFNIRGKGDVHPNSEGRVQFSVNKSRFETMSATDSTLTAASASAPGITITNLPGFQEGNVQSTSAPLLNGRPLAMDDSDHANAVAVQGRNILFGTSHAVSMFNQAGRMVWEVPVPDESWLVNLSGDGRLAISANGDGTIRWFRTRDGKELLAFRPTPDGRDWILWTPSGYFAASSGAENSIGWLVNHGADQAADFFPASRFADTMRRPDIVSRVLETLDESEAVRLANASAGRQDPPITPTVVATLLPPVLDLVSAPTRFATDSVSIQYQVRAPADAPMIGEPRVKVDGEWQPQSRAAQRIQGAGSRTLVVTGLPARDMTVELYAENRNATSTPLAIPLKWDGRAVVAPGVQGAVARHKGRLFVLAVGISQYQRPDLRLNFADHDAQQFVAAMQAQQGKEYAQVNAKLLVNGQATLAGIHEGLQWLESQASGDDVGILFIAGHGFLTTDQHYFFAPAGFDPSRPRDTGVEYTAIRNALVHFAGAGNRAVLLVDTCYAGGAIGSNLGASGGDAFAASLGREEYSVVALTAANGGQLSYEDAKWGDGAFTKALLEAIVEAKADPEESGTITVLDLGRYVSKRVPVLTQQRQEPLLVMPSGGLADFPIASR